MLKVLKQLIVALLLVFSAFDCVRTRIVGTYVFKLHVLSSNTKQYYTRKYILRCLFISGFVLMVSAKTLACQHC
jgi:hypothetical protein